MQDFRQQVVAQKTKDSEITALLRQGQLAKAIRKAKVAGFVIPQEDIDTTAKEMFLRGCASTLLAMIGTVDIKLPYDTATLLNRAFEAKDYHGFLKQAYRLHQTAGLQYRIQEAILKIEQRSSIEAAAWRNKFTRIC